MKILVFGGSGFLGSHVADALSVAGHVVTIFDVRSSPYLRSDQKMVVGDILNQEQVDKVVAEHEIVYHFAGIADIDECVNVPVETVKYNVLGTVHILEACRKAQIKRFVFASSAYVYSDAGYFYKTSKQACESYIEDYNELFGLPFTCLRYGSLYGERADERNSIYKMIKEAITTGSITYHGTGQEIREFVHVKDAARVSVEILDTEFENQNIVISGAQAMRYEDLLEMLKEIMGGKINIDIKESGRKAHYKITPYNFSPKLGKRVFANTYIDMGQGLLQCISELYSEIHTEKHEELGVLVDDNQ
jgi:UDP-glucose 4-epimerase